MYINTKGIPNIKVENIGNRKHSHYSVNGFIELLSWTGYYLYDDSYRLKENKVVANGRIELYIVHGMASDGSFYIPQEQANAYYYLVENEGRIKHEILEALKKEFPRLLSGEYASWDHEDPSLPRLSELTPGFDFKNYIGPGSVNIEEDVKDDQAYVTWRFRCKWDPEHGLEVITHKDRIIDIAPEADIYKIYKDNGTYSQVLNEDKNKVWKRPPQKKNWWQFW